MADEDVADGATPELAPHGGDGSERRPGENVRPLDGEDIGPRRAEAVDDILVQALAEGLTQLAAGKRAGVTDRTVRRRLEDKAFSDRVRAARRRMTDEAAGRAAALLGEAVEVVGSILRTADPGLQLRAAQTILRVADQTAEVDALSRRVEELETAMAAAADEDVE